MWVRSILSFLFQFGLLSFSPFQKCYGFIYHMEYVERNFQEKASNESGKVLWRLQHCNYNIATTILQLQHCNYNIATLQHYNTTTLQHYNTTTLQHYNTTTLERYNTTTTTLSINDAQHTFIIHIMLTFLTLMLNAEYCVYAQCPFATAPQHSV